jgi:two-component system, LuxR family, response regulator FixJ
MAIEVPIHVVDDDKAIRESLAFLLGTAGFRVELFDSATPFLEHLSGRGVACLITDIRMPGIDGIELLRRLRAEGHRFPVIVMTGHGDVPLAVEAMKLGAFDFLEKPFDDEVLIATVGAALRHGASMVAADNLAQDIANRIESLTPRERQVLDGLVAGHSNKTIGRNLEISPRTIEIYRANVMTKMRASSVSELVRLAIQAHHPG